MEKILTAPCKNNVKKFGRLKICITFVSTLKFKSMEKVIVTEKVCKRCGVVKGIEMFRTRPNGFTLNQCRKCEAELGKERRVKKIQPEVLSVTTKSGKEIEASLSPITGGRKATSPNTDKVLYFNPNVGRDAIRVAFSSFANVPRTGIKCEVCV
jgi:hypothetical protein